MLRSLAFTTLSRNALVAATVSAVTLAAPVYAADPPPTDPTARAEWLSGQAELAFSEKRFADAIRLYLDAWEAAPAASILYNVAFIYDKRLDDPELAIDYYERAAGSPDADADLKTKAGVRVAALRAQLANKPIEKPKDPDPITPPPESSSVAPWIVTATGGALLAGGIAMAFVASSTETDFQAADSAAEKRSLQSDGRTQALVADLLMGVGAVGVATGVIWLIVDSGSSSESRVGPVEGGLRFEPRFIPGGAAFVLGGTL